MDSLIALLSEEGKESYYSLSPIRRRVAAQMMIAAAHMTGRIHIEEAEELQQEINEETANSVLHIITRHIT